MIETKRVSVLVWKHRLGADGDVVKNLLFTLLALSIYMDSDGSNGHVRETTLAETTGLSVRAIRDHLARACEIGYLSRVTRGHRLGNGETTASTYEATVPADTSTGEPSPVEDEPAKPQPAASRRLRARENRSQPADADTSTGESRRLNRQMDAPQPADRGASNKEDQVLDQLQTKDSLPATPEPPKRHPAVPVPEGDGEKDLDLVGVAVEAMYEHTGKQITREHGQKIVAKVLGGRRVGDPAAYLREAIARDPIGWLRFGETGHDAIARLMSLGGPPPSRPPSATETGGPGTIRPEPSEPAEPAPTDELATPTPDPVSVPKTGMSWATPDEPAGEIGSLDAAARAALLKQIRRGVVLKTPRPVVGRSATTPNDRPTVRPDPDVQRLDDHGRRQAETGLHKWAAEHGMPYDPDTLTPHPNGEAH